MKIVIGSDFKCETEKKIIFNFLKKLNHEVIDSCSKIQVPNYLNEALRVSENVGSGNGELGIIISKQGLGASMVANRVRDIRCSIVHDTVSAKIAKEQVNLNVLALAVENKDETDIQKMLEVFLSSKFKQKENRDIIDGLSDYEETCNNC